MDAEIPTNFDTIIVEVQELSDFEFMEERQEVEINDEFSILPIAVKNNKYQFTNCTMLLTEPNENLKLLERNPNTGESSYQKVVRFLNANKELLTKKLSFLKIFSNEIDKIGYHRYSNFGVCGVISSSSGNEGLISTKVYSNILKRDKETKVYSTKMAKVYVYSPISITAPLLEDEFTNKMISKSNIVYILNHIVTAPETKINIKLKGGIIQW